ncbi:hypothetical protein [Nafulsella turpanensis]|uniref:hypothetical protein n=1 Tax=Nafulsella turpanensis TaxID=1265690 RepID=UPI00034D96BF|nr:hypothetical protein [Nafulsella turpanensis]
MIANQVINKNGVQITTINMIEEVFYLLSYNAGGGVILKMEVAEILVDFDAITMEDFMEGPERV